MDWAKSNKEGAIFAAGWPLSPTCSWSPSRTRTTARPQTPSVWRARTALRPASLLAPRTTSPGRFSSFTSWDIKFRVMQSWEGLITTLPHSASMSNMAKLEEMERLLREAQVEKQRLLEHRVGSRINAKLWVQMQMCVSNEGCERLCLACAGTWDGDSPAGLGRWEKTTGGTGETATGGDKQEAKTSGDWDEAQGETKISGIYKSLHINPWSKRSFAHLLSSVSRSRGC